ncbi:MAG: cytochrome d ubiquinol oxidase subunit II [Rhodospirillaceae bacterium]|nr:cytochrome d ubiquinol oxidase subunit II [Rhodospirillaceae bacterium]
MSLDSAYLLPLIWALVIAFGVAMYVVLDGFDLGIGILFPFVPSDRDRDRMMASVAPVWDGNETWLVLGGASLFGAFPKAYAQLLPAFYLPLALFLFALIFRGVSFEFRARSERSRPLWNVAFAGGSTIAAFAQGVILGAFVEGAGASTEAATPFSWLSPFSVMVGLGLVCGYALLGATWLILKTEGPLQAWCDTTAKWLLFGVLGFVGIVSLWTPFAEPEIAARWFSWPEIAYLSPVPILTGVLALTLWRALATGREKAPFLCAVALILLAYLGLGVSLWPYAVPREMTIWQAAAGPKTQGFLLVGVAVMIPLILAYTAYTYRVFRGKVRAEDAYH